MSDCFPRLWKAREKVWRKDPIYALQANPFQEPTNPSASKHLLSLVALRVINVGLGYKKGRCVHLYEFLVSEEEESLSLSPIRTKATEFQLTQWATI